MLLFLLLLLPLLLLVLWTPMGVWATVLLGHLLWKEMLLLPLLVQ